MTGTPSDRVTVELTPAQAELVVAALRQYEPYWPGDMDEVGRMRLLTEIREGIELVDQTIDRAITSAS